MKVKRITPKMVLKDKVNGKKYIIMDDMMAYPILPESMSEKEIPASEAEGIKITKSNAMAFKIVYDPTYDIVPSKDDFNVKDGIIMSGGYPVTEQGELKIGEIISAIPGGLICTTKKKNGLAILAFNLTNDKFKKIISGEYQVVREVQQGMLYLENCSETEKEDGTKTIILEDASIIFNAGEKNQYSMDLKFIPKSISTIGDGMRLLLSTTKIGEEDESGQLVLTDTKKHWISIKPEASETYTIKSEDEVTGTYSYIYDAVVLKSDKMIDIENRLRIKDSSILEYLRGYDFLVDITPSGNKHMYTFANWKYDCKTISVEVTSDRGNIIKIVKDCGNYDY